MNDDDLLKVTKSKNKSALAKLYFEIIRCLEKHSESDCHSDSNRPSRNLGNRGG